MFLFDLLFGKKRQAGDPATGTQAPEPAANAPGTRIHHDPELIATLKADHELLLEVFTAIGAATQSGDLGEVQKRLGHFRTLLTDHLLKENVRLYIYLEHMLQQDAASHRQVREFRQEMDAIGKAVVAFLGKYKDIIHEPHLAASLAAELGAIGEVLVGRIRREEETLYPMYAPLA